MTTARPSPLRLAYYGDDFTGSTDALQVLARAGHRVRLFMTAPTPEQLAAHGPLDAVGVAGHTRSLPTAELDPTLRPVFEAIHRLAPRHVHYKVCSTFDSSPSVGSIGRVMEIGGQVFNGGYVPIVVGAPALGRWCVFGNLFARYGIGSDGEVYRLDRHPAMRNHPSTPATESDLRRVLADQTEQPVGLIDLTTLNGPIDQGEAELLRQLETGARGVLFDAATDAHLARVGELLELSADRAAPLFSIGSSGVESALAKQWSTGPRREAEPLPSSDKPLLVLAGSCSPVTAGQIDHALGHGFADAPLDTAALLDSDRSAAAVDACYSEVRAALAAGQSVVVHTSRGEDDPRRAAAAAALDGAGLTKQQLAERIGAALGQVGLACRREALVDRVCVAGGDTSSYAGRALGIDSLTMRRDFWPGAPICLASATNADADQLEVVFKGGQVGGADFFTQLATHDNTQSNPQPT